MSVASDWRSKRIIPSPGHNSTAASSTPQPARDPLRTPTPLPGNSKSTCDSGKPAAPPSVSPAISAETLDHGRMLTQLSQNQPAQTAGIPRRTPVPLPETVRSRFETPKSYGSEDAKTPILANGRTSTPLVEVPSQMTSVLSSSQLARAPRQTPVPLPKKPQSRYASPSVRSLEGENPISSNMEEGLANQRMPLTPLSDSRCATESLERSATPALPLQPRLVRDALPTSPLVNEDRHTDIRQKATAERRSPSISAAVGAPGHRCAPEAPAKKRKLSADVGGVRSISSTPGLSSCRPASGLDKGKGPMRTLEPPTDAATAKTGTIIMDLTTLGDSESETDSARIPSRHGTEPRSWKTPGRGDFLHLAPDLGLPLSQSAKALDGTGPQSPVDTDSESVIGDLEDAPAILASFEPRRSPSSKPTATPQPTVEKTSSSSSSDSIFAVRAQSSNTRSRIEKTSHANKSHYDLPPRSNTTSSRLTRRRDFVRNSSESGSSPFHYEDVPHSVTPSAPQPVPKLPKTTREFSVAEAHLLIYLKDVKQLAWSGIVPHFTRTTGVLQSYWCTRGNRRDRSKDPDILVLPQEYAAEAASLWPQWRAQNGYRKPLSSFTAKPPSQQQDDVKVGIQSHKRRPGRPPKQDTGPRPMLATPDPASGNEGLGLSGRGRPRRNVQAVNYSLPGLRLADSTLGCEDDSMADVERQRDSTPQGFIKDDVTEIVMPVDEPLQINFSDEDANIVLSGDKRPYISYTQRILSGNGCQPSECDWDRVESRDWRGCVIHVDFSKEELKTVQASIARVMGQPMSGSRSIRKRIRSSLNTMSESKLARLAYELRSRLKQRDRGSIDAFLHDARDGKLPKVAHIDRLGAARPDKAFFADGKTPVSAQLRQRELGLQSRRGWKAASTPLPYRARNIAYDTLGPSSTWAGASGDVHTLAWSPDGEFFAVGAVAVTDAHSMQYNRSNNLLYGDLTDGTIHELGAHKKLRCRAAPESGPNPTPEMIASQDRYLHYTVSSVAFSPCGQYMYSGGYDGDVNRWSTRRNGQPIPCPPLRSKARVEMLDVNADGVVATAMVRGEKAIRVTKMTDDGPPVLHEAFTSKKAQERPYMKILPTALRFEPEDGRMLLAGFGANQRELGLDSSGDICLYDVETLQQIEVHAASKNVFDLCWVPNSRGSQFAVGCVAAGSNVNKGVRSVVCFYEGTLYYKRKKIMELECPAYDMNEVVLCPYDPHLAAAGCTDGRIYLWDVRQPNNILHTLSHGKSVMPLDPSIPREISDIGVRFVSWGNNATRLYTGSSDGVIKVWDPSRNDNDVFIEDLVTLNSGVMSGAFSPENDRLLIGEVNNGVSVFEVGNKGRELKDADKLRYIPYNDIEKKDLSPAHTEDHTTEARHLLNSGQLMTVPFGGFPVAQVVQGPNYCGPFDSSLDAPQLRFQLKLGQPSTPQCDIPACKESIVRVTQEELGDSGRSKDRIPFSLLKLGRTEPCENKAILGMTSCSSCGRLARPNLDISDDGKQFCERCRFKCFRCVGTCEIKESYTSTSVVARLHCTVCKGVWEAGALGYELIEEPEPLGAWGTNAPLLSGYEKDLKRKKKAGKAEFEDEGLAETEYYLGLGETRPRCKGA
ncbi:hypothetical protein M011DRAFT_433611 [Sporormia fimetaria CBS 119925]|uniref:Uncharacterized protein n=1 Tax=Sporormia fimetaria CBS 119925 TaxID=1340428 RepID=A0A6A6UV73_9PLEO|nr:hypothetical protein M011DRAFT_433611 [Sporormia fimetaria CBS 119925]